MSYSIIKAGHRFGKLVTVSESGRTSEGRRMWICRCDCGREIIKTSKSLKTLRSASCGCGKTKERKPRKRPHAATYKSWVGAIQRCHNERDGNFPAYGARGISVCEEWRKSFAAFLAYMGERPEGTSLDRFPDGEGNYEPGNCRWATPREQALNRRTVCRIDFGGEMLALSEVAERSGIPYERIRLAYHAGSLRFDKNKGTIAFGEERISKKSKFSDAQILEIRNLRGIESAVEIGVRLRVTASYIRRIQSGARLASPKNDESG